MASTATPEASEIRRRGRQRLIGAVALVLLLVVFVPMILDSEPRPARTTPSAAIPARDNPPPLPTPAPAAPPAAKAPVELAKTPPAPPASIPPSAPIAEPKTAPAPRLDGFAVQVGAFRDEAKLKQAREKLAQSGVLHYTERLESAGGPLTRLRAGPFPTREAAEAALAVLKRASLDGKVVALP